MLHLAYACLIMPGLKLKGGGMERVQTKCLMTESAGTAQGVDVALGGGWERHGACKPNFCLKENMGACLAVSASSWPMLRCSISF